jgi:hypothetical protein
LIKYQGRGDLDRMYLESRSYRIDFNLASIPVSFSEREKEPFDLEYMNALFDVGYNLGRHGYHWQKKPPDCLGYDRGRVLVRHRCLGRAPRGSRSVHILGDPQRHAFENLR